MIRKMLSVSLLGLIVTGAAYAGVTFAPNFNAPRQGQIAPSKTFWLQSRSYSGENGAMTSDFGSVQAYALKLHSGVVAHCVELPNGYVCGYTQTGSGYRGVSAKLAHFASPHQGQITPVAVFWLQSRSYSGDNGAMTSDAGSVSEYLLPLSTTLTADCLIFAENEQCVYTDQHGTIISSSGDRHQPPPPVATVP